MIDILYELNEFQKEAVTTTEGPLLILAGAGSGKTKVITHRIAYLLSLGIPEDSILALTFTNKAAGEMKKRIENILESNTSKSLWVSTFHSFGARILRTEFRFTNRDKYFTIFDTTDVKRTLKIILEKLKISKTVDLKTVLYSISTIKNKFLDQDQVREEFKNSRVGIYIVKIFVEYEKYLEQNNAYDFDDLLYKMVILFQKTPEIREKYENKFSYIMIDEFQDTNSSQLELVKLLTQNNKNICIVGDEDQSIYQWRGAEVKNILNFPKMYKNVKMIDLKYNYRCGSKILDCAISLIEHNSGRFEKDIMPINKVGEKVQYYQCVNDDDGINYILEEIVKRKQNGDNLDEMAVVYRTNAQSRMLEKKFKGIIPYKIIGSMYFYERKEIKDILSLLQVVENSNNNIALLRVMDNVYKGIGKTTLQKLIDYSFSKNISIFNTVAEVDLLENLNKGIKTKLKKVYNDLKKFIKKNSEDEVGFESLAHSIFTELNYYLEIEQKAKITQDEEILGRLDNLNEFRNEILEYITKSEFPNLTGFLEDITLQMQAKNSGESCVNFLTLHSSKGLEYKSVFIYGIEDGLIPLIRGDFDLNKEDLEEERRLLYVGMTRAKKYLTLIKRLEYPYPGKYTQESRFIDELSKPSYQNIFSNEMDNRNSRYSYEDSRDDYYNRNQQNSYFSKNSSNQKSFGQKSFGQKHQLKSDIAEIGEKVIHKIFGVGKIVDVKGNPSDPIVFIDFLTAGKKKLKYNLAGLTKI